MRYYMTDTRFANSHSFAPACDDCVDADEAISATEAREILRSNRRMARDHARNSGYPPCFGTTTVEEHCAVCGEPVKLPRDFVRRCY